ncbi:hypothetical protein ACDF64_17300 [Agromyces sp. MMS24-JH15]|uniref:hypothetical protein n=1 Tax=Agromyces sp. MMS24-JH15 TaxID=3243765 RepID=UPI00374804B6
MDLAHAFFAQHLTSRAHDRLEAPSAAELAAAEARATARARARAERAAADAVVYTERGRHRAAPARPQHA